MMKGFSTQKKIKSGAYADTQEFVTVQKMGSDKRANDVIQNGAFPAVSDDIVEVNSTKRIIIATGHAARVGDFIRIKTGTNYGIEMGIVGIDANNIYLAGELLAVPAGGELFDVMRHVTASYNSDGALAVTAVPSYNTPVDFLDAGAFIPSTTTIPRSTSNAVQVVAVLAAQVRKIQVIEDIGSFMAIYSDAARTALLCYLPLAGGDVDISIPAATTIYLGAVYDVDISTANTAMMINFLG